MNTDGNLDALNRHLAEREAHDERREAEQELQDLRDEVDDLVRRNSALGEAVAYATQKFTKAEIKLAYVEAVLTRRKADNKRWLQLCRRTNELIARAEYAETALATARRDALEEAARFVEEHVYTTNGGELSMEPASTKFPRLARHHATIAAAIRALTTEGKCDE